MNGEIITQKGNSLLPAIAYGDAAGLPVETRSAEYIAAHYGKIDHLIPSSENPFYIGTYEAGLWSDDTQLSLAVAEALIESDGFDLSTQAQRHVEAYDSTPDMERKGIQVKRGWGGSTIAAMRQLKEGMSPTLTGTKDGSGNGILMKMAPLAYWQAVRATDDDERIAQYDALTSMTHDSDVARLTTQVHGDVVQSLMQNGYEKARFVDTLYAAIGTHALRYGINEQDFRAQFSYLEAPTITKDVILAHTDRKGFYAPQTLAMAYGAFVAHDGDGVPSIYEAVNLGGDTDSTASIVAAMSTLASENDIRLPIDHQNIFEIEMIKSASQRLAAQALRLS